MDINADIFNINKGPFLSDKNPKIGPTNIIPIPCDKAKNCKAFPLIPIIEPNVLQVPFINDKGKYSKNDAKVILQNLKVFNICLILFFFLFLSSVIFDSLFESSLLLKSCFS